MNTRSFFSCLLFAAAIALSGCGDDAAQKEMELFQESVEVSLDAWKKGESAASLKARPTPIEFHDEDWQRKAALVSYEIKQLYRETDGTARCAVTLTMKPRGKAAVPANVTYQVKFGTTIVIARDPYS